MENHLYQAAHNYAALEAIEHALPQSYFDWKTTICFYASLHIVRAYAVREDIPLENDHYSTLESFRNGTLGRQLSSELRRAYQNLYHHSRSARYDGFVCKKLFDMICKRDLQYSKKDMGRIRSEMERLGLVLPNIVVA